MSLRSAVWVLVAVGIAAGAAFYTGVLRFNYPSKREFPVRGIDVSHHQGMVHWFEASLNGVQFAYLKATEGRDYRDRDFLYNWRACGAVQIACGAYHFFSFCQPGAAQAKNFLAAVPPGVSRLPPALDLEFSGNCKQLLSRAAMVREVSAFVRAISQRFPSQPVFYATPSFYKRYLEGHRQDFPPHRLWIRDVLAEPSGTPCQDWTFWQYGDRGRIPGTKGPIDLNVFCGSPEEFKELQ